MSTLSAARADNFYYPPGWDPSKESLNQHTGHTKGRNQYEQKGLIRFELPFDGWCTKCGRHVVEVWNGLPRFMWGYLRREDGSQEF